MNKSKSIKEGDRVTIVWADGTKNYSVLVVNRPRGEGDAPDRGVQGQQ